MGFKKVKLHKFDFFTGTHGDFNDLISKRLQETDTTPLLLAHYNLHGLYKALNNQEFASYLNRCKYSWIDGFGSLLLLKLTGNNIDSSYRTTFLDWQDSFFSQANNSRLSIFLLGSTTHSITTTTSILRNRYPEIRFSYHDGYFDLSDQSQNGENAKVIEEINLISPDILLVGMGMPRQENWINQNADQLNASVIMPIGGYFDYIAGETKTPNRFLSGLGLEWLIRLVYEPRRLAYRYLIEPWYILYRLTIYYFWKK